MLSSVIRSSSYGEPRLCLGVTFTSREVYESLTRQPEAAEFRLTCP